MIFLSPQFLKALLQLCRRYLSKSSCDPVDCLSLTCFQLRVVCRPVDDARVLLEAPELLGPCDTSMPGILYSTDVEAKGASNEKHRFQEDP